MHSRNVNIALERIDKRNEWNYKIGIKGKKESCILKRKHRDVKSSNTKN